MKINGIFAWVAAAAVAAGLGSAFTACNDSVASPVDNNLLKNPDRAKAVMTSMKGVVSPLKIGDDAVPIRQLLNDQVPAQDTVKAPDSVQFHEKIPTYSRLFNMKHDGKITVYTDANGTNWYHIGTGSWATYYSPDPSNIPPGTDFHVVDGKLATANITLWHIDNGPYQTMYYNPGDGGSVWKHDGISTYYVPVNGTHIETGPTATFYQEAPVDTVGIPADLRNQFK
ncbi:MAG TPA: hypothetical protein VHI13_14970 [Candidatus Kapabacteria bacterium]|nr:hypothetical protein [Candidatus Kapabacteria bacterium]